MDFFDVLQKRFSVRSYKKEPVEQEKLNKILEAAQLAPTACNLQSFKIIVAKTDGRRELFKKIYHRPWFSEAPYVLGVCALTDKCWVRSDQKSYADVDAAIVMDHIILAATALGLGTCWIGAFDPEAVKEAFELEDGIEPIAFTPLGYPNENYVKRKRKPLEELVIFK
ncbi:MAG: nitroreductase [Clostridiaceae bacterium]|nr:nitroreductase [Clostridiaceae bacterium]